MFNYVTASFSENICCDVCMEVTASYLEVCPVCEKENASIDYLGGVYECFTDDDGIFSCEECRTKFKIISYDYGSEPEAVLSILSSDVLLPSIEKENV